MLILLLEISGIAQLLGTAVIFGAIFVALTKIPFVSNMLSSPAEEPYVTLKLLGTFVLISAIMVIAVLIAALLLGIQIF